MMRYPFATIAPLLAHMTAREVADAIGASSSNVRAWRLRESTVSERDADALATMLHMHPSEIWTNWPVDVERTCERCPETFVPAVWNQRFCGARCRIAAVNERRAQDQLRWKRERYARDPEYAERKRANAAKQYAECGDYVRAQRRARYAAQKESA